MAVHKLNKEAITINILSSVIGYGVYFPALILCKQLKKLGFNTNIYIIERFFNDEATSQFIKTKEAFKTNVRLVQIASKLPVSYTNKFDEEKLSKLFNTWENNRSTHFLCFSGLWLEALNDYKSIVPEIIIDCCRVDSEISATWEALRKYKNLIRSDFSFFNATQHKINYILNIPSIKPKPFHARNPEVTIHGGGWDLGNFKDTLKVIEQSNYHVNLILNDLEQLTLQSTTNKSDTYANKPKWNPLFEEGFPPFGKLRGSQLELTNSIEYPGVLKVIIQSSAIMSKPGGMTLMDSLITETPLIFLKSIGKNENGNRRLWENLQIGLTIEDWNTSNFSITVLEEMYHKIIHIKKETPCLVTTYIHQLVNYNDYATQK